MATQNKLSVRVRMYRQGLGDCFLLTFNQGDNKPFNMMIDCGLLQSTTNQTEIMTNVVTNIEETTDGELDVVALTHEHWDHISGFQQAKEVFDRINFDEIWLGWTEDKSHAKYNEVQESFKKQIQGLKLALTKMDSPELKAMKESVEHIVNDFYDEDILGASKKGKRSSAWEYVLNKEGAEKKFCSPGRVQFLKGVEGVRIYILGPPTDFSMFRKTRPKKNDTYESHSFALADSVFAAFEDSPTAENFKPFEESFREEIDDAKNSEFFKEFYGFEQDDKNNWRQIENDWLASVGELALHLDNYTNNTCLAIAIELIESGKVLLFPGDAQYGNWISWKDLSWEIFGKDGVKKTITSEDLLAQTVLYKVGHHGSHNATLRENGLEKMTNTELVAMIPVDREKAKSKKWRMPLKELFERLEIKTKGRILMADEGAKTPLKNRCENFLSATQTTDFLNKIDIKPLFVEYMIEDK